MSIKKCCVPTCDNSREDGIVLHCFPNPKRDLERFYIWKNIIGGHIADLDNDTIFALRKVCHMHFETRNHTRGGRLSANAVPTLHLSSSPISNRNPKQNDPRHGAELLSSTTPPTEVLSTEVVPTDHQQSLFCWSDHTYTKHKEHNNRSHVKFGNGMSASEELNKAVFSWETEELIISADDADVFEYHQEASALSALEPDLTEVSLYQDDDPRVTENSGNVHSYSCNECGERITGLRHTCVQCADWDLCAACEARAAHAAHYLLRVPRDRPYKEIQAVLTTIRRHLLSENHLVPERAKRVKSEPEEPPAEPDPLGTRAVVEILHNCDDDDMPEALGDGSRPPPARPRPARRAPATPRRGNPTRSPEYLKSPTRTTSSTNDDPSYKTLNLTRWMNSHSRTTKTRQLIPLAAKIPTKDITVPDPTTRDCSKIPILKLLPITKGLRLIKKHKIVDENASEVKKPRGAKSADELAPPRTDPCTDTTALPAPTTTPKTGTAKSDTRAISNLLVRVPAGFDPADVAKMLKTKVSVRLKPIDVSSVRAVNKNTENSIKYF